MDIDLLSKMITELILDNDEVTLPGVGTFVAEVIPSTFSDKGYTINPPYRKLSFRQRETSDISLIDFYARSNGLDTKTASSIMLKFLGEMTEILKVKKAIVFPGLGRLRATKENNFFFVADEDLNIYPEGFGLEPVSLKTHVETEDDVEAAVAGLQSILDDQVVVPTPIPEPEPVPEPTSVEAPEELDTVEAIEEVADETPVLETGEVFIEPAVAEPEPAPAAVEPEPVKPEPAPEPVVEVKKEKKVKKERKPMPRGLKAALIVFGIAAILLGLFILLANVAPDFTDKLLYSPEELEILRQI